MPKLYTDAATLAKYGCFLPNGEVLCFCNTEPRIKAIRRVTRKETSPNLGREFWSCGNWVEGASCSFFLWYDDAASRGRKFTTPPPPGRQSSTAPVNSPAPPSSPQKRPRVRSPSVFRPAGPAVHTPSPSKPVPIVTESFYDIDFDAMANVEDEIEDADQPSSSPLPSSPSKKPRFESFASSGTSRAAPSTPSTSQHAQGPHWQGAVGAETAKPRGSGFDAIRTDPESPFHTLQKTLFGGEAGPESSPVLATPSKSSAAAQTEELSALDSLFAGLKGLTKAADAVKKEREKDARLQTAAKRKEETLRKAVDRAKEETEGLKLENVGLKERIRLLEEENNELRTR